MFTRDSVVWWLAILGAIATYLGSTTTPTDWDYRQWIQAGAFLVATLSGKLATSPLPHSEEGHAKITESGE